ncbi:hypothetical protein NDK43_25080 [Neobacillus pocheonensis]|uniref:Uncharacterized protein n=1 Tax=Neobacillus pocheonensis TaxID=363869 RepID=A0ABT0WFC2_9BACI|nr:hypothetical protein [Neobacillus pocheonensis]
MNWISFITGGMSVVLAYSLFSSGQEEEMEAEFNEEETVANAVVKDFAGRYVTLSCQTCRKLKKHMEIVPDVYQCTKCKRHTDLRPVS